MNLTKGQERMVRRLVGYSTQVVAEAEGLSQERSVLVASLLDVQQRMSHAVARWGSEGAEEQLAPLRRQEGYIKADIAEMDARLAALSPDVRDSREVADRILSRLGRDRFGNPTGLNPSMTGVAVTTRGVE